MRKITFFALLVLSGTLVNGQTNTFPSSGTVGVGTISPSVGKIQIESGSDNAVFLATTVLGNGRLHIGSDASANVYLRTWNNVDLRMGAGANDQVVLKYGGNFGINTTAPTQKFEVNGTGLFTGTGLSGNTQTGTYINSEGIYSLAGANGNDLTIQAKVMTFYTGSTYSEKMRIDQYGQVGIGVTSPGTLLHLSLPSGSNGKIITMGRSASSYNYHLGVSSDSRFLVYDNDGTTERLAISPTSGNVAIGNITATEKFNVDGNTRINGIVKAKQVVVTTSGWSDYVFDEGYKLPSLNYVAAFIKQHKHLPDIPSAKEISEKGINVGDNQSLLLKKIEELTLYLIESKKEVETLKSQVKILQSKSKK